MHYLLSEDLSCCEVDGHLVFLDLARDRYFRLAPALESAVRDGLAHGAKPNGPGMEALAACNLHGDASDRLTYRPIMDIPRPTRSASEDSGTPLPPGINPATIGKVMSIVWSVRRQLQRRPLKAIIRDAIAYRGVRTESHGPDPADLAGSILFAASQFAHARRYVPIDPRCLLDSLSLLHFLSRRGLPATIVFGVTLDPFAAHCWVQANDIVLNETLSDALAHTPIRTL